MPADQLCDVVTAWLVDDHVSAETPRVKARQAVMEWLCTPLAQADKDALQAQQWGATAQAVAAEERLAGMFSLDDEPVIGG